MIQDTKSIPTLTGSPVVGSLREFQRDRLGFLLGLRRRFGDVARFRLIRREVYLLSRPDAIQHVLVDSNKKYHKGQAYSRIENVLGNGLLTSQGDFWLRQRRLVQPAFHHRRLEALVPMMSDATEEMLQEWETLARSGEPFDESAEMMKLTLTIVGRALFSADVRQYATRVREAMNVILEQSQNRISRPFDIPAIFPTQEDSAYRHALNTLNRIVYGIIEERRRSQKDEGDLLSMLIQATDEGSGMNDEQLRDEVMTLFLAGHETTANALSWTWYLLSKDPAVEHSLSAELAGNLGGRALELKDLENLPYNRMVIEESMRLYPPAWLVSRTASVDDTVDGVTIPAGAVVFLSQYVTHRHPDYWDNPEGFDPERFSPERSQGRPDFAYFPFGGGPRKCIGNYFAMLEAQVVLATVAQRYRLELMPGYPVIPQPTITLRPRNGIWMRLKKKDYK